jgi:hypothetical protein
VVDRVVGIHRLLRGISLVALCSSLIVVADSQSVAARSGCDQANPTADAFITVQTLTSASLTAVVTNAGPCTIPDGVVTFTLPSGSTVTSIQTNPNSWNCSGVGTNVVTCPSAGLAPTIGVPGNHDFALTFTLSNAADQSITANVTVGGGVAACTDGDRTTTCDPYPDNNTVFGAAFGAGGGSLTTCPNKPCQQYADLSVNNPGTVQTQLLTLTCPPGFPDCFGKFVVITTEINGLWTKTFTVDLALRHGPSPNVRLIRSVNGSDFSVVQKCGKTPVYPCIAEESTFKIGGTTFKQWRTISDVDDSWGFDG